MKRLFRIPFVAIVILAAFNLTACGTDQRLNLTEGEEKQIVGYAADILLKYGTKQTKLVDTTEARELAAKVEAAKEAKKAEKSEDASDHSGNESEDGADNILQEGNQDIAAAIGLDGFEISFAGYDVCDSYPEDAESENYFAMDATLGKKLMVLHFNVTNVSEEDKECNILNQDPLFRVIFNGSERKNALTTLLLNDMATMDEMLEPSQTADEVVVVELDEEFIPEIQTASFYIKAMDEYSTIPIITP